MGLREQIAELPQRDFLIPCMKIQAVRVFEHDTVGFSFYGQSICVPYKGRIYNFDDSKMNKFQYNTIDFANSMMLLSLKSYIATPHEKLLETNPQYIAYNVAKREYLRTMLDVCKAADKRIHVDLLFHLWLSSPNPSVRQIISHRMKKEGGRV